MKTITPSAADKTDAQSVAVSEADRASKVIAEGRDAALQDQGIGFVKLNQDIAVYRIDTRPPVQILAGGGYNPWTLGEQASVLPPSNIPDYLRHEESLPFAQVLGSANAAGDSQHIHPLYRRIPSNPGANMGITCTAQNPYGSLSALSWMRDDAYMAIMATNQGLPITALYQTQDMLDDKLNGLASPAQDQSKVELSYNDKGQPVYSFKLSALDGVQGAGNSHISIVDEGPQGLSLMVKNTNTHKLLKDKVTKEVVGFVNLDGDKKMYDLNGKEIIAKVLTDFDQAWCPSTNIRISVPLTKENLQKECKINFAIGDKLYEDILNEVREKRRDKSQHANKHASYEFEFSDIRKGVGDIIGWAKIKIVNGTQYEMAEYISNPYFDTNKHPEVVGDKHLQDIMDAADQLKKNPNQRVTISSTPQEIVTPLSKSVITQHCSKHLIEMESVTRDKQEMQGKMKQMNETMKATDLRALDKVKVYKGADLAQMAVASQAVQSIQNAASLAASMVNKTQGITI